jgi:hypothetical protein
VDFLRKAHDELENRVKQRTASLQALNSELKDALDKARRNCMTKSLEDSAPPRFDYKWEEKRTLIMTYKSKRNLIDFAVGLVKGVGKFYKEEIKVSKLSDDKIQIVFPG